MGRALLPRGIVLGTFLAAACLSPRRPEPPLRFVLLHTNDLHGQLLPREVRRPSGEGTVRVGGFATIGAYVASAREEARGSGADLLLVDAGDWYQGTPEGARTKGGAVVEWMNLVGYDAAVLGNHEFDHGLGNLRRLLDLAKFPVLAANVFVRKTGERPAGIRPHAVLERKGIRFAFVGLLSRATPDQTTAEIGAELRFDPEEEAVGGAVEAARREADLVFLLTHCGLETDRALARLAPEVSLVVGGHSHTRLAEPERVGAPLVLQTGSKGGAIGRVEFTVDPATKEIGSIRARLVDLSPEERGEDPASAALVRREEAAVRAEMDEEVGTLLADLPRGPGIGSSPAGNLVADAMREAGGADVAFTNKGGVRTSLLAGPVTRRSFFELLPFENTVVVLEMTGAEIEAVLRASLGGEGRTPLEASGILVRWRRAPEGRGELLSATVGGAPIDPVRAYRVAVNSFLARGGDGYRAFAGPGSREDKGVLLRDAAVEWFRRRSPVRPAAEERFEQAR
ncbi:MAG: bifunctional metallophosphatase/5'-nucleotidase [Planctomycetota bacterium]